MKFDFGYNRGIFDNYAPWGFNYNFNYKLFSFIFYPNVLRVGDIIFSQTPLVDIMYEAYIGIALMK